MWLGDNVMDGLLFVMVSLVSVAVPHVYLDMWLCRNYVESISS